MATRYVTLRHRGAIPHLPNSTGARSLYTRASITLSRWRRSANNMLQDFIIIGQSNIPISTAAPTHYARFYTHTHIHTHFLYSFKTFWAFVWGPSGSYPLFSDSPSSATYPHNFSDVSILFLTSFFKVPSSIYIQV